MKQFRTLICTIFLKGQKRRILFLEWNRWQGNWPHHPPSCMKKINEPLREMQLQMEFSEFWQKFLQELQNKMIGSWSFDYSDNFIEFSSFLKIKKSLTQKTKSLLPFVK